MRKILLTSLMGALLFVGLATLVAKAADPYPDCQSDCAFLVSIGFFKTKGACMSACHACTQPGGGATPAVCLCKLIDAQEGLETYGLNFGQCVKIVKGN